MQNGASFSLRACILLSDLKGSISDFQSWRTHNGLTGPGGKYLSDEFMELEYVSGSKPKWIETNSSADSWGNRRHQVTIHIYVLLFKCHLCLGFILVLVEIQSFSPQDKPTQLPVFHDTPLSLKPACLQCFLLIQRRAGPGDPGQLTKHHALGPCCMDTHIQIKWGKGGLED